jgi:hypothetical protein
MTPFTETRERRRLRRGVTVLEFLVMLAILAILVLLLLPALSFSNPKVLADGVLLYKGEPLDDVRVFFRPVLDDGSFGDQAYSTITPDLGVGGFEVVTTHAWRERNSPKGLFVANLDLDPAVFSDDGEEQEHLKTYLDPETSPLRFQIPEEGAHDLRIELGTQTTD